jgi:hypothetical protein
MTVVAGSVTVSDVVTVRPFTATVTRTCIVTALTLALSPPPIA